MQKIIMVGLDAAGKTCLFEKTFNLKDPNLLAEMLPTQGVERQPYEFIGADMIVWDMGGQTQYRDRYFEKPEMLQGAEAIIFVVDIQDPDRLIEAVRYWAKIFNTIEDKQVRKYIFYHKFDPNKSGELKDNLIKARELFGILDPFFETPPISFATSIYGDTADRAAKQILWDILPPVEFAAIPTPDTAIPESGKGEVLSILPTPTEEISPITKITDRLAILLDEHLQKHDELIALGIYQWDGTYVSGVAKFSSNKTLLQAASNAIKTVGETFSNAIQSVSPSKPIPMDFGEFTVCFEAISPEHIAATFSATSPSPEMLQTISQINKSLNQALGFIPASISRPETAKLSLIDELKAKLREKRTLTDFES